MMKQKSIDKGVGLFEVFWVLFVCVFSLNRSSRVQGEALKIPAEETGFTKSSPYSKFSSGVNQGSATNFSRLQPADLPSLFPQPLIKAMTHQQASTPSFQFEKVPCVLRTKLHKSESLQAISTKH